MDENKFSYNYSAPTKEERREIEDIKRRYSAETPTESKMERLRHLDKKVKRSPTAVSLSLGIVGTLVFGLGLTMVLEWNMLTTGIIVMLAGCLPIAAAYPLHNLILAKNKKKYGEEIVKISEELLGEEGTAEEIQLPVE